MFRFSRVVLLVSAAAAMTATSALAVSNAHFVGSPTIERAGNTLITSGKVAGLGDVQTITVSVTGDAYCINPGSNRPKAANKADVAGGATIPVQNGKADYSVLGTATFQPDCTPPMTVAFKNVAVTVTAADGTFLKYSFPGTL